MQAMKWKLVPPTLNFWTNLYLQNSTRITGATCDEAIANTTHDMKHFFGPKFMVEKYLRVMSILDVAVHDFQSLEFPSSLLAAGAVSFVLEDEGPKTLVQKASGFTPVQIEECRTFLGPFFSFPGVNVPPARLPKVGEVFSSS